MWTSNNRIANKKMTTETISRPLISLYLAVLLNTETQKLSPILLNRTEALIETKQKRRTLKYEWLSHNSKNDTTPS
jgi:hypothetical protein